ncbi:2,5-didehydrogluconate reductase DkgB [Marinimicrobium alkaliphilum]|uniref:2,5-didehydrogluconate reductase DkgB n=1 Tax=Marinimicrobium alkaliphilum TaxID=2202654 RepID=UPI000DB9F71E|nr:2,5-didehydrogluconate reductase DkgB [Marinimicrobium alkaliphilum]
MTEHTVLPPIGLGTFRLQEQVVIDSVLSALALGYRHIDTATFYENEAAVGKAIRASGVPREEIFVTTKIWWDQLDGDGPIRSLEGSLERLGLTQVDLALIHWPSPNGEVPMADYLDGLGRARAQGLTRHIGVSNFTIAQIDEALALPVGKYLVTNQVEVQPYLANRKLVEHCQRRGLQVTGYMPLAVGKVMKDPVLKAIGERHGASAAQVALAWVVSRGIAVIPASTNPQHQQSNLEALELTLNAEDIAQIDALDAGERIANPPFAPHWDQ